MSHIMTKPTKWHVRPVKTQISLGIRPVWSESSLSAWRKLGSLATNWVHSKDSDQTGRMPRLIWVFAGPTCHFVGFVMRWLNILSCVNKMKWAGAWHHQQNEVGDQNLPCALNGKLRTQGFFMRTAKTRIRLGRCQGWSESLLGAQVSLLVLSCSGSNVKTSLVSSENQTQPGENNLFLTVSLHCVWFFNKTLESLQLLSLKAKYFEQGILLAR